MVAPLVAAGTIAAAKVGIEVARQLATQIKPGLELLNIPKGANYAAQQLFDKKLALGILQQPGVIASNPQGNPPTAAPAA